MCGDVHSGLYAGRTLAFLSLSRCQADVSEGLSLGGRDEVSNGHRAHSAAFPQSIFTGSDVEPCCYKCCFPSGPIPQTRIHFEPADENGSSIASRAAGPAGHTLDKVEEITAAYGSGVGSGALRSIAGGAGSSVGGRSMKKLESMAAVRQPFKLSDSVGIFKEDVSSLHRSVSREMPAAQHDEWGGPAAANVTAMTRRAVHRQETYSLREDDLRASGRGRAIVRQETYSLHQGDHHGHKGRNHHEPLITGHPSPDPTADSAWVDDSLKLPGLHASKGNKEATMSFPMTSSSGAPAPAGGFGGQRGYSVFLASTRDHKPPAAVSGTHSAPPGVMASPFTTLSATPASRFGASMAAGGKLPGITRGGGSGAGPTSSGKGAAGGSKKDKLSIREMLAARAAAHSAAAD